jgi:formylglycine-generating enzyme required for sulfatase activity
MIGKALFIVGIAISLSFSNKKEKMFIPPGTVQITESFFADETEVSNFSWFEYEFWVAEKYGFKSKEHLSVLPDTLVWRNPTTYNEPYVKYYYRHPAFRDYPVVGVSYEQALAYCKWRTERVKEFYRIRHKKEIHLEYRLPNNDEWESISNNAGNIFSDKGKTSKGISKLNCKKEIRDDSLSLNADLPVPVYSYWKNYFGLFNVIGNIAEMISEKNVCKGGSWIHYIEECRVGKTISYSKPEAWLGFRCVCVMAK